LLRNISYNKNEGGIDMLDASYAQTLMRSRNMRMTPQRRVVIDYLIDNTSHPVVEDVAAYVQERMPNVALSTIYNILHELTELGLIQQVDVGGVMHFDPDIAVHAHLRCDSCGNLVDITLPPKIQHGLKSVVEQAGAQYYTSNITVAGVCPSCEQQKQTE
jgi:Fur family peroxide stress response transcriptional regulator